MSTRQPRVGHARGGRSKHGSVANSQAGFQSSEGLRILLHRLDGCGDDSWHDDPEAADLMTYAAKRYASLARKHGLDPWEAASAAFDAMRTTAVRRAADPWAVVTRAVQVTMIAEERANGLLCSTTRARRPQYSVLHDIDRFCDRDERFPELQHPLYAEQWEESDDDVPFDGRLTSADAAIKDAVALLAVLGWQNAHAREVIDFICARLADLGSRAATYENLRRDQHARALLDVPAASWTRVLRVILGSPDPDLGHCGAARGVLLRLMIGEPLRSLLSDMELVLAVEASIPTPVRMAG
jgi:hypothetical protein